MGGAGVDDRHPGVLAHAVDDEVVSDAGLLVEQEAVAAGADGEGAQILGEDARERVEAAAALDPEGVHVAGVEETRRSTHACMLCKHACVLQRHVPAAEFNHACPEGHMPTI